MKLSMDYRTTKGIARLSCQFCGGEHVSGNLRAAWAERDACRDKWLSGEINRELISEVAPIDKAETVIRPVVVAS